MEQFVAVGTYTTRYPFGSRLGRTVRNLLAIGKARAKGVYVLPLDPRSGELGGAVSTTPLPNPSWVVRHPRLPVIYAISEAPRGKVTALRIAADGRLQLLNERESGGGDPCYAAIDHAGRRIYVANYATGNVACIALDENGHLGDILGIVQHEGRGPNRQRQDGPHPHAVVLTPDDRNALVPDLGADLLIKYEIDGATGRLLRPAKWRLEPGSGPRHLVLHPSGRVAFLVNELTSTVASLRFEPEFVALQECSTLPPAWQGASTAADIRVHPSGRFLYVSNRGWNGIAAFRTDADGALDPIAFRETAGRTPRGMAIDSAGCFLLAAFQDSDEVISFRISPDEGVLEELSRSAVPTSASVVFL